MDADGPPLPVREWDEQLRARGYRVWFQFQKKGIVNTAYFDIPVADVESASNLP